MNAVTAVAYSQLLGELDLTEVMRSLSSEVKRVQAASMAGPEAILTRETLAGKCGDGSDIDRSAANSRLGRHRRGPAQGRGDEDNGGCSHRSNGGGIEDIGSRGPDVIDQ